MTGNNRMQRKGVGSGRRRKIFPVFKRQYKAIGGIPMRIVNGKIKYAQYVPHNYTKKYDKERGTYYEDEETVERNNAVIHQGKGNIARIMIYELRHNMVDDETDEERRKREYREWWEREKI